MNFTEIYHSDDGIFAIMIDLVTCLTSSSERADPLLAIASLTLHNDWPCHLPCIIFWEGGSSACYCLPNPPFFLFLCNFLHWVLQHCCILFPLSAPWSTLRELVLGFQIWSLVSEWPKLAVGGWRMEEGSCVSSILSVGTAHMCLLCCKYSLSSLKLWYLSLWSLLLPCKVLLFLLFWGQRGGSTV